uniref:Uncharacterized protein n=1 Tax=Anguilla anguilla TaxID=7936 RepID=A0A0E9V8A9_ANGAN
MNALEFKSIDGVVSSLVTLDAVPDGLTASTRSVSTVLNWRYPCAVI